MKKFLYLAVLLLDNRGVALSISTTSIQRRPFLLRQPGLTLDRAVKVRWAAITEPAADHARAPCRNQHASQILAQGFGKAKSTVLQLQCYSNLFKGLTATRTFSKVDGFWLAL